MAERIKSSITEETRAPDSEITLPVSDTKDIKEEIKSKKEETNSKKEETNSKKEETNSKKEETKSKKEEANSKQEEASGENEELDTVSLKKLIGYSKRYIPLVIAATVFSMLGNVGSIIGPKLITRLTNTLTEGIYGAMDLAGLRRIFASLITVYAVSAAMGYVQLFITSGVSVRITQSLRRDMDSKLNRLPLSFFDGSTRGDLLSRVTNDVSSMSSTLSDCAPKLLKALVLFFGVLIMMFGTNVLFTFITLGTSLLGLGGVVLLASKSQRYFNLNQSLLGKMDGHIEEIFTNHSAVRLFGAEAMERAVFAGTNDHLREANRKSQVISGLMTPLMSLFSSINYVLIFVMGVAMIAEGRGGMDLGTIVGFTLYAKLLSSPLETITQTVNSLQESSAASRRVFEILEAPEPEDESMKSGRPAAVKGEVEFRNVIFGYKPGKPVIRGFSAKLEAGQRVAIVGPTGAGKTTLVNLLMRFYETDSGDILIDGVSVRDMKRETVHGLFDMILQDSWLFTGTIRENLVFNQGEVPRERLDEICRAVGLEHFIETLPMGYDTPISDSLKLSEGQKQQLTIARAMVQDSPLLILDEATSSVDSRTELVIQRAMEELTRGRTSFVIAHRLSTIKNADVILVMRDGDIVESGRHEELMAQRGFYAELFESQFGE